MDRIGKKREGYVEVVVEEFGEVIAASCSGGLGFRKMSSVVRARCGSDQAQKRDLSEHRCNVETMLRLALARLRVAGEMPRSRARLKRSSAGYAPEVSSVRRKWRASSRRG